MRVVGLVLILVSVAALSAGCSGRKTAPNPLAPSVYLDHALELMRTNAVYTPTLGWGAVIAEADKMAATAKTPADTYGAIIYALDRLRQAGDMRAGFTNAFTAKLQAQAAAAPGGTTTTPPPTVSLVSRKLGLIELPEIASHHNSPDARHYAASALRSIASLQARDHPCGWIVDLRENGGGDMDPMLLSVGPILGQGRVIGFTGKKGFLYYVSYRDSALSGGGSIDQAPLKIPVFSPSPPVAVLTSTMTASAGEVVAVAFRGRADTKSFGAPTAGATSGPRAYRLVDGAEPGFAISWYVDRDGVVYKHPIKPDVAFPDSVEQAAENWLMSTAACSRTH